MNRLGVLDRVREHALAATGLALALLALALALLPGSGEPRAAVLALRHAIPAGGVVRPGDVVAVPIAASDRTPSMLAELGPLAGRRTLIGLAGGDFVVRGALRAGPPAALLAAGERAVALELAPESAPDVRLLRPGRHVDVIAVGAHGSHVAARDLELLSQAVDGSRGVAVTVRAPTAVALDLATRTSGRELRLLLRGGGS